MEWTLDASIALAWCFEDKASEKTDALLDRLSFREPAVVPAIWPLEIANVLTLAARKRRITQPKKERFLTMLLESTITVDSLTVGRVFKDVISLAEEHGLTAYDASYLELAIRRQLPLATLDKALLNAARVVGVAIL